MSLITRFYGPNAKGSKLTVKDMDENLYYLQSFGVDSVNYNNNVLTFTNPTGGTYSVNINSFSGLTINGSLSATTYYGDGSNLTGITTENTFTTGGTYDNGTALATFTRNDGNTYTLDLSTIDVNDTFVTGFTYDDANTLTISRNDDVDITTSFNIVTGLTVNGDIEMDNTASRQIYSTGVSEISSIQYLTSGTSIQMRWDGGGDSTVFNVNNTDFVSLSSTKPAFGGLSYGADYSANYDDRSVIDLGYFNTNNRYVTGGTYNDNTDIITLLSNDGGSIEITGVTDTFTTGGTYISSASTINFTNNDGGTFSVTGITSGGGSSSGVVGISDATGTYTYYNNLNEAISAATAGQVVELFADIEETGTVSINLKGGVDINFNGHSYTLNETTGVPNVFNTSFMSDGDEVHMWNGKINRIGSLNFTTGVGFDENRIVANTVANVSIYWHDCVLECSNGGFIYASKGSFYGGIYLNYHPTATASWGLIHTSTGGSAKFYDFRMMSKKIMNLKNYGGKFYNCSFYNESYIVCGLYNTAAELHNCHAESDGHSGVIGSNGFVYNSFFKSTSNQAAMDFGGTLWNCTGISSASNGLKAGYSSSKAYNCTAKSATNFALSINSTGAVVQGGLFLADSFCSFLSGGNTIGATFIGGTNSDTIFASNNAKISGCNIVVRNTTKNAISGSYGNPASIYYANNTIIGNPTVPIDANVTQLQTTTHDTFGNIVLD